jgi:hypothetical protein
MSNKELERQFKQTVAGTGTDLSVGGRFGVGGNYMNNAVTPSVGRRVMVGQRGEPSVRQQMAMAQMGGAQTPSVPTGDPVSPYGGNCLAGMAGCEYDPAEFCGWSILPWSTLKSQGTTPNVDEGPVLPGTTRIVRITSERACQFRVRGVWFRGYLASGTASGSTPDFNSPDQLAGGPSEDNTRPVAISEISINNVPRVVELGGINPPQRVFTPSTLFDGTFWVLPTDWGVLSPINNTARPLELQLNAFGSDTVHCFGVLFGDVIGNASGTPAGLPY